ncbi:MAG TPA: hypothetical protein VKR52_14740 [Terracidiphilus sp.]|nr:hypothetical protein [Terracidiphilus sp.]
MQRTLAEHIAYLEQRIAALKNELENPSRTPMEKVELKIDLGIAERSLAHFQKAFALERKLSETIRKFGQSSD